MADGEPEDQSLWKLDSDLNSFIVEGTLVEEEEVLASSLPNLDFNGLGKATQAMIRSATKPKRPARFEKLFTSDITDNDAVVSSDSDSDDDAPLVNAGRAAKKKPTHVIDTTSEASSPVVQRQRVRRVIQDDDSDE